MHFSPSHDKHTQPTHQQAALYGVRHLLGRLGGDSDGAQVAAQGHLLRAGRQRAPHTLQAGLAGQPTS